jgi:hypothetical protein
VTITADQVLELLRRADSRTLEPALARVRNDESLTPAAGGVACGEMPASEVLTTWSMRHQSLAAAGKPDLGISTVVRALSELAPDSIVVQCAFETTTEFFIVFLQPPAVLGCITGHLREGAIRALEKDPSGVERNRIATHMSGPDINRQYLQTWESLCQMDSEQRRSATHHVVEERWNECETLRRANEFLSAMVRVAEVSRFAEIEEDETRQAALRARVAAMSFTQAELGFARAQWFAKRDRMLALIQSGREFEYEEIVLVLTGRIELELAKNSKVGPEVSAFELAGLDAALREMVNVPRNRSEYRSARISVARNWGVPLNLEWLDRALAVTS